MLILKSNLSSRALKKKLHLKILKIRLSQPNQSSLCQLVHKALFSNQKLRKIPKKTKTRSLNHHRHLLRMSWQQRTSPSKTQKMKWQTASVIMSTFKLLPKIDFLSWSITFRARRILLSSKLKSTDGTEEKLPTWTVMVSKTTKPLRLMSSTSTTIPTISPTPMMSKTPDTATCQDMDIFGSPNLWRSHQFTDRQSCKVLGKLNEEEVV